MTETLDATGSSGEQQPAKKRAGGLNSMLLADLKSMAGGLGIAGAGSMKKAQLVEAIKAHQAGGRAEQQERPRQEQRQDERQERPRQEQQGQQQGQREQQREQGQQGSDGEQRGSQQERQRKPRQSQQQGQQQSQQQKQQDGQQQHQQDGGQQQGRQQKQGKQGGQGQQGNQQAQQQGNQKQGKQDQNQGAKQDRQDQRQDRQDQRQDQQDHDLDGDDDGPDGGRRNRRRRGRDRTGRTPGQRNEPDTTILEDDVLVPAAGILDVLDNYAFVRTGGYLPSADDVYLSLSMVRRFGLRRGDAVVGQVRLPREGERKEKFNPMVRLDAVNGGDPEAALHRVDFTKLTPVHPTERLRLETDPDSLVGRMVDIAAPIGKGQRGLVVSPAKAGKTMLLQSVATAVATNNPECHLMVVLLDERPEEVTDFERSVKGEVISSTFDRPAGDHTTAAELAIERAKRLVELGHDVVVLLDGLTRLGRAYNLSAPAGGRVVAGGVDAASLHPPKRFFGAARNIEDGGSLTILATALVESGSTMDETIFEELQDTANAEIWLRGDLAEKRLFPAVDAVRSGTRRDDLLLTKEELEVVGTLRRSLAALDAEQSHERLVEGLGRTQTNIEFLMQVQKSGA